MNYFKICAIFIGLCSFAMFANSASAPAGMSGNEIMMMMMMKNGTMMPMKNMTMMMMMMAKDMMKAMPKAAKDLTPEKPATDVVKILIKNLTHDICTKIAEMLKKPLPTPVGDPFMAVSFRNQIENGTNYFIKVMLTGDKTFWHVKINNPVDGKVKFVSVMGPKMEKDMIEYFE